MLLSKPPRSLFQRCPHPSLLLQYNNKTKEWGSQVDVSKEPSAGRSSGPPPRSCWPPQVRCFFFVGGQALYPRGGEKSVEPILPGYLELVCRLRVCVCIDVHGTVPRHHCVGAALEPRTTTAVLSAPGVQQLEKQRVGAFESCDGSFLEANSIFSET